MEIGKDYDLLHTYFGAPIDCDNITTPYYFGGQWQPYKEIVGENYRLGCLPLEYPTAMSPDYRTPAFEAETSNGVNTFEFKYIFHEILNEKPKLEGMPAVYSEKGDQVQTLKIVLVDDYSGIEINLFYTVFESFSAICRHTEIRNIGRKNITIKNVQSASLDFPLGEYDYIHLSGAWAREKHLVRDNVSVGSHGFESRQGASSNTENPFMLFGSKGMNENYGDVYGISLIYSGNHKFNIESVTEVVPRVQAGINPFMFSWKLKAGESFTTPEAVIAYSDKGISEVSKTFHKLYRTRLCRGKYRDVSRPILVNNWEGTYFNFNREKLLGIADVAAEVGIELFVLDDGWFGKRDNDKCSLGDWFVNEQKLGGSLKSFADDINRKGLAFGLWFEPEMVSPDSDLYRAHPDWAVQIPSKKPFLSRSQLILDFTKPEVRDYIVKVISDVLSSAHIDYVKWDKNRYLTEPYSTSLASSKQGEFMHRYILGLYDVMERITSAFPNILFESCSGGGARNDPAMLYYMPQTWISDNTDAVERQFIQYGASLVYPVSSWGAHVSAVPNHQTGRITSLSMRGTVAQNGAFGYELDLTHLSQEEKIEIAEQIKSYKKNRNLVCNGDYYRLLSPYETDYSAWMYVSSDRSSALVYFAVAKIMPNPMPFLLKLKGLDENKTYRVNDIKYTGRTLMNYGLYVDVSKTDNFIIEIKKG